LYIRIHYMVDLNSLHSNVHDFPSWQCIVYCQLSLSIID
jgi:hypothetical protein